MVDLVGTAGMAEPGGQILANQLNLSQPGGADSAHQITTRPPDFRSSSIPELTFR